MLLHNHERGVPMIITTVNDLPGHVIEEVPGEVLD
jgi:hypothetical protein